MVWCEVELGLKFYPCFFAFQVCNTTTDRNHADSALEKYVTETVMAIVKGFFSSPFSVNHANLQVLFLTSGKQVKCTCTERLTHDTSKSHVIFWLLYNKRRIFDIWLSPSLHICLKPPCFIVEFLFFTTSSCLRCLMQMWGTNGSYQRRC